MLIRPANIITAISDILAGSAIAGYFIEFYTPSISKLILLLLSTSCLYAGGIVFNDIFDINIDRSERPERPLPKGQISLKNAQIFGISLFEAFCVVPPKPVTLQNKSYKGTAANDKANINKNIETKAIGVKFFLLMVIKFLYCKFQYCRM